MQEHTFLTYVLIFLFTLLSSALCLSKLIPFLRERAKQPIYEEGPRWHLKKAGTPTMGGVGFVLPVSLILLIFSAVLYFTGEKYFSKSLAITSTFALLNSAIGIFDDLTKLKRKENAGLSPSQKIFLQSLLALGLLLARKFILFESSVIYFSFGAFDLGALYYPLSFIAILGTINCANLTDGIDGLASGVAFAIGVALFYISAFTNTEVAAVSAALIGASVGFLIFNLHPAKIFMGDTGSLFFGAITVGCAFSLGNPLIIAFVGIVYLIEGFSVILQVTFFKLTKKRIFKMAPIHHHFEKCGWSENKIVLSAIFLTLIVSLFAFAIFV